nr:GNAT family protein [Ornithinimicrobium sp. F0845]
MREVGAGDARALHAYRSDPQVIRFLGHPPLDVDGVGELLTRWRNDPTGVSVVAELHGPESALPGDTTTRLVGDVRVRFRTASAMAPATTDAVEAAVGYAFHPEFHGQGLATECVRAVLRAVLGAGARRVTARVFAPATPSSRLLARLGFSRDGVDRAAVLAPDGAHWWDDELWSLLPEDGSMP